ncbi:YihY/virulence factor BrkB family protein [Kitasatospora sp. NA04385]|uniref:YihY/virulence factor BrkB family protein n=1 Tax=Kitasatospora sp. NA04385 TaxID=2742135 RepID=UPI0020CB1A5E|nr:YihY/virulence factor BrkB family protein [Kitasatospora sp. NA04385]
MGGGSAVAGSPEGRRRWWRALRRTPLTMWNDDITDFAAALTYYAVLAILPALLATVVGFALISPAAAREAAVQLAALLPGQAGAEVGGVLAQALGGGSAGWTLLVAGAGSALWSCCSYLAVFRRALHRMHGTSDRRSPLRKVPRIVVTAAVLLVLLAVSALALILSGPVAEGAGRVLHLGGTAPLVLSAIRWPVLLVVAAALVLIVFRTGPEQAWRRWGSLPGGVLAAVLWLVFSAGFALYTSVLGTYSHLYGSLAGTVVFLIWLWLSNLALLAGAQFTAELRRAAGLPVAPEPTAVPERVGPDAR